MDKGPVKATHTLYIGKLGECPECIPDLPRININAEEESENISVSDFTTQISDANEHRYQNEIMQNAERKRSQDD